MSGRRLRHVALVVLAASVALTTLLVVPAAADAGAEADFVSRINGARSSRGLGPLATDGELTAIARRWSQRMANDQRLSHNPNLAKEVTQDWEKLAENVGTGGDVESIHTAFMNSTAHRTNILDGALTHVGVGVVVDGGQIWVTEVFMRLRGGGSSASPPPTTAAPPPPPTTTTARPRPAPTTTIAAVAPAAPATTARPAAPAPTTPPPPPPEAPPTTTAAPPPAPTAAATSAAPSPRLVLVLERLRALDRPR